MSLVPSLLQAIIQVDGEALVMHAGDKPYVVSPTGQVDLASRGLTLEAVNGIIGQLLPPEVLEALDEFGAAQYQLPTRSDFPQEQFTVVAARGGDDLWAEIRRRRIPEEDQIPEEIFDKSATQGMGRQDVAALTAAAPAANPAFEPIAAPPAVIEAAPLVVEAPSSAAAPAPASVAPPRTAVAAPPPPAATPFVQAPAAVERGDDLDAGLTQARQGVAGFKATAAVPADQQGDAAAFTIPDEALELPDVDSLFGKKTPSKPEPVVVDADEEDVVDLGGIVEPAAPVMVPPPAAKTISIPAAVETPKPPPPKPEAPPRLAPASPPAPKIAPAPPPRVTPPAAPPKIAAAAPPPQPAPPAVVLPMSRSPIRAEPPPGVVGQSGTGLDRLLRLAAARGASTLYLATDARPSVRVDGENQALEGEAVLSAYDVESLLLTLMPERSHEALRSGAATEWINDFDDIGRVRCMSFSDHRGPGGVFRLMPVRAVSMDQLVLTREMQALAIEPEGLVLIAGPRSSGKRTLISAYIDLINRTRRDHVISIESEINVVHERGSSFVSQREVRGSSDDMHAAARAALREDPDVLVIEDLRTGALMNVALEAAASGHLVIGGFSAHSATGAIDRIIDLYAPEYRRQIQMALAEQLRGVVAQVLLRRQGGGRVAARELLLNTPAVASVIAEGKTSQLPMAIEGGRRHGMLPLNDALVGFVQSGIVEVSEAYRRSPDRTAFLSLLKRQGIDTSALERLA